jgi:hypothetical protein
VGEAVADDGQCSMRQVTGSAFASEGLTATHHHRSLLTTKESWDVERAISVPFGFSKATAMCLPPGGGLQQRLPDFQVETK